MTMKAATAAALAIALVLMTSRHQAASFFLPDPIAAESSPLSDSTQKPLAINSGIQRDLHLPGGNQASNATGTLAKECEGPTCSVKQTTCKCNGFCEFASSQDPCICTKRWYCTLIQTAILGQNSTEVGTRTPSDNAKTSNSNQTRIAHSPSDN